jgi:hypothetical protein
LGRDIGRWAASLPSLRHLQLDLTGRTPTAVEGFFDDISLRSGASTPSSTDSGVFSGDETDFFEIRKSTLRLTGNLHSKGSFAQLRQVHLTGAVSNIVMFLTHLGSPLTRIDLVIEDPPEMERDWQDLFVLLGERLRDSLQSLRIAATGSSRFTELVRSTARTEAPFHPLPLHYLTPMHHLTRLDIDLPESVIFYDSDISHLASTCPNLEVLKLCPVARFATNPPSLTLEGIASLLSGCARLHTLAVVIDAKQGSEEVFASSFTPSRSLLRLHVGHSWVKDPVQVTVLLSHLAPYLEILKWFNERNRPGFVEANCRGWERVNELLPHVQSVRLMERERALATSAIIHIRPPTSDKSVDATVLGVDQGVSAILQTREVSTQSTLHTVDQMVEAKPSVSFAAVDARPAKVTVDVQIDATYSNSQSNRSLPNTTITNLVLMNQNLIRYAQSYLLTPLTIILAFVFRLLVAYPLYIPLRLLHFCLQFLRARREAQSPPPSSTPEERVTETITEPEKESVGEGESPTSTHSSDSDYVISPVRT